MYAFHNYLSVAYDSSNLYFCMNFSDDHSRVLLQRSMQVRQRQSDYINANYIDVRKLAYMYRTYI